MREALPRCAALADQILRKETGKGILETYMPANVSVLMLRLYAGAVTADTGRTIKVTVRNYQAAAPLREYLTNINNPALCARNLHIHKNTLYYRINKICDMFDLDLNNGSLRMRLQLSLELLQMS